MGNLHQLTIVEAANLLRVKKITVTELVTACLTRINEIEDKIQAFRVVDEKGAMDQARELDAELKRGKVRGLLHGIPVGIKDIFDVKGFPTRAGSLLLEEAPSAKSDSTVVARLREAGAVILGKTHTTTFAYYDPAPTHNPYQLCHTPGGSSSGSAAAITSDMALLTIGSQTNASICRPGAYSGAYSFKPTSHRINMTGVKPLAPSFDTPGFFGRCVYDLLAGFSPFNEDLNIEDLYEDLFAKTMKKDKGSIGVLSDPLYLEASVEVRQTFNESIERLEAFGYQVETIPSPVSLASLIPPHQTIMAYEAAKAYEELATGQRMGGRFEELIREGQEISEETYKDAHQKIIGAKGDMGDVFERFDFLVTLPTDTSAPKGLETTGNPKFTTPWTVLGGPLVVIPVGLDQKGLPLAIMLAAAPGKDLELIQNSLSIEKIMGTLPKPKGILHY
jgi:aspartyl-tRNA(Asn)/glutamyl-tRNA(Gln) amidotransferase subunit A